jgi:hypothetical protein
MNELERLNRENCIILKKKDTLDTGLHFVPHPAGGFLSMMAAMSVMRLPLMPPVFVVE